MSCSPQMDIDNPVTFVTVYILLRIEFLSGTSQLQRQSFRWKKDGKEWSLVLEFNGSYYLSISGINGDQGIWRTISIRHERIDKLLRNVLTSIYQPRVCLVTEPVRRCQRQQW